MEYLHDSITGPDGKAEKEGGRKRGEERWELIEIPQEHRY
jgi:hypothetical protein